MMDPADDVLGLSHEARAGTEHGRGLCLDLLLALNDDLVAAGIVGQPAELQRRYAAVMAGRRHCPLQDDCPRYRRAEQAGKRFIDQAPRQLKLSWATAVPD